jgi:hypothetical protein
LREKKVFDKKLLR